MSPYGYVSSAGLSSVRRRPTCPDIVRGLRAPVAQGIERCPAEAEVACSIHAGRTSRRRSSRRRSNSREVAVVEPDHERFEVERLIDYWTPLVVRLCGEAGVFAAFGDEAR